MRINLQNTEERFSVFLRKLERQQEPQLVSFIFNLDDFNLFSALSKLNNFAGNIFLFQSPDFKYSFIALNTALVLSGSGVSNVSGVRDYYNRIKNGFINNWNELQLDSLPLICTAVKFDPLRKSDDWEDFEAVKVYIPEFTFYTNDGKTFGCFNFIYNEESSSEKIKSYFLNQLTGIKEKSINKSSYRDDNKIFFKDNSEAELNSWMQISAKAVDILSEGRIQKLVISRSHSFIIRNAPEWSVPLGKLTKRFPDCYLFFIKENSSHFFGSSPELFLKIFGNLAEVESVAGSAPRGIKNDSDEMLEQVLRSSKKNHKEHEIVTNFISDTLLRFSDKIIIREEKQVKKLDNIQHLTTKISAELKSEAQLFEIIDALFPTPAVCGLPKDEAMSIIRELEPHDRGLYSGLIGWMDFEGNCELAVAIRSTLVKNNKVTAYAGAGLVKDSNPEEEFLETNLKLDPILSLFKQ